MKRLLLSTKDLLAVALSLVFALLMLISAVSAFAASGDAAIQVWDLTSNSQNAICYTGQTCSTTLTNGHNYAFIAKEMTGAKSKEVRSLATGTFNFLGDGMSHSCVAGDLTVVNSTPPNPWLKWATSNSGTDCITYVYISGVATSASDGYAEARVASGGHGRKTATISFSTP